MISSFFVQIFTPQKSSKQCTENAFTKEALLVLLIHSTEHSFKLSTPAAVNNFQKYCIVSANIILLQETCFEFLLNTTSSDNVEYNYGLVC